jgi:RNA polymerase sigma-70 factor (ECF subfamily)
LSPFRTLLDAVWQGNETRLSRLAVGLGLRSEQAADVLQDVYVTAAGKPPAIACEAELVQWLFRVTVNRCHLEHRRRGRWRRLWSSLATVGGRDVERANAAEVGELKADVRRALAAFGKEDRTLVAMRYFSDLNSRQIGEIVGLPEATVRGRLRSARRRLAGELAEWNDSG